MPSQVSVLVEVKSYIKSYLQTLYGGEPVIFPRKSMYNRFMLQKVVRRPANAKIDFDRAGKIEILLPYNAIKNVQVYNYLGRDEAENLRKMFKDDFTIDFREFIKERLRDNWNRKEATLMFMDAYNISEDDISFAAFYRDYSRQLRKRRLTLSESEF